MKKVMKRHLHDHFIDHCQKYRQMIFLSGPRQVGKTTVADMLGEEFVDNRYFNWDDTDDRALILNGQKEISEALGLNRLMAELPLCMFDELHKYRDWRNFLKGFFDKNEKKTRILVTGSASLKTFRRSGDSLMGRYFSYTLHPISVAECLDVKGGRILNRQPASIGKDEWEALWKYGGFPEPFLRASQDFYNLWKHLKTEQLFREDLRDLTRIQELDQMEMLARLLRTQVGQLTSYSYMAKTVRISVDTVRRWIATLESLYFCFTVRPWYKNVARSLRKEPKYYLWDWSQLDDAGARAENMVASALLKAVHWWTETGKGDFGLYFLRDKQKHEVDFLVTRNQHPWFLAEVKSSGSQLSKSLMYFQKQTQAEHAFQVALDAEYVDRDCFEFNSPIIVPGKTFLSQLV